MYRYTSAPPPPQHLHTYLQPPLYPHNLASRSYGTTYMSRPYQYTEPRRYNSYYETAYTRPSTSHRLSQSEPWRHVRPAQVPQPDKTPRKSNLKKTASRHVHFDLPPAPGTSSRTIRIAEEERQRERERVRAREKERDRDRERERETRYTPPPGPPLRHYAPEEKMPKKPYSYTTTHTYEYDAHVHRETHNRTSSPPPRTTLPRSHSYHASRPTSHTPYNPPAPAPDHHPQIPPHRFQPPHPTLPTVYIITYATDLLRSETAIYTLLSTQLPHRNPPIPHLYTIDARNMRPPSAALCAEYSGISPVIQDVVMEDGDARRAARRAVDEVLRFGERDRGGRARAREMEVSLSVCCHSGTHRSVAIAERIAQCVKSEVGRRACGEGVRVVCRHVHRVKGRRDPF